MLEEGHSEIVELIPEYVLGSLSPEEAALVEQHLAACDTCRQDAAAYAAVVDALPLGAALVEPPADLKGQLMATIRAAPAPEGEAPERRSWRQALLGRAGRFWQGPRWRPALVLVLLVLVLAVIFLWPRTVSSPAPVVELTPTDAAPGASGLLAFGEGDSAGMLTVNGLPVLPAEEQYQLWLIVDGQRDSGAIFSVDAAGEASLTVEGERPLGEYGAFGITIEPAGGSPGPTGERVLGFNL